MDIWYLNTSFTYVINDNFEDKQNTHLLTAISYVRNKIFNGKNHFFANLQ